MNITQILIDECDAWLLKAWDWHLNSGGYVMRYERICVGKRATILLHRVILGAAGGMVGDHISGNKLDNRRSNLRSCLPAENLKNRKRHKNNRSGYKGVYHDPRPEHATTPWRAQIRVDGRKLHLGTFADPEFAHAAYCAAATKYHGEFARFS